MYKLLKKKIKSNLNLIKFEINKVSKKNKNFDGCCDEEFIKKKKNFASPPFQYFSINYYNFSSLLKEKEKEIIKKKIIFLTELQNTDGSFDEWYKNERSFCTSSYTSFLISNLLLKNKFIESDFKKKLKRCLSESFFFLKGKFNFNILNQNLAKLAFLQNYQLLEKNQNNIISKELILHLNKVHRFVMHSTKYEYKGIDLGYLTVSLMLSAEILKRNDSKKMKEIFLKLITIVKNITYNFKYFSNYIFSRSSRIFLLSGFYFAYRQNMIKKKQFLKIYNFYNENFNKICLRKDLRYLSFFYSTDQTLLLQFKSKKIFNNKLSNPKYLNSGLFSLNSGQKRVFIYKQNPNLTSFLVKNKIKIHLCETLLLNKKKYIPSKLIQLLIKKNKIYLKQGFIESNNYKNIAFKYLILISFFSKVKIVNKFINYISKYLLILRNKQVNDFKKYRIIYVKQNKIIIKDIVISKKKNLLTNKTKEVNYFSPTSFLLNNEIMSFKKVKTKKFNKMNKKVITNIYEY